MVLLKRYAQSDKINIMKQMTWKDYREYLLLKKRYKSDLLLESAEGVTLENDIDLPVRKCVMGFALLGCDPKWSCCGFDYAGQPIHKHHEYGRIYFILGDTKNALSVINSMIRSEIIGWKAQYNPQGIDLHCDFKNVVPQWEDRECLHYSEPAVWHIHNLEVVLSGLYPCFMDTATIEDSNSAFKKSNAHWQYPAKAPWTFTKEQFLERIHAQ